MALYFLQTVYTSSLPILLWVVNPGRYSLLQLTKEEWKVYIPADLHVYLRVMRSGLLSLLSSIHPNSARNETCFKSIHFDDFKFDFENWSEGHVNIVHPKWSNRQQHLLESTELKASRTNASGFDSPGTWMCDLRDRPRRLFDLIRRVVSLLSMRFELRGYYCC